MCVVVGNPAPIDGLTTTASSSLPTDGVVVRLKHTFSIGFGDRQRASYSPTSTSDETAFKFPPVMKAFSPESGRKRFSLSSNSKRSISNKSTSSLSSPNEESPLVLLATPSGQSTQHLFDDDADGSVASDARCRALQEDTNSLQSGQTQL